MLKKIKKFLSHKSGVAMIEFSFIAIVLVFLRLPVLTFIVSIILKAIRKMLYKILRSA